MRTFSMEDTNEEYNKTTQKELIENGESEISARNEQTVQKCTLSSEEIVGDKNPSKIPGKEVIDEQTMSNDSTEELPDSIVSSLSDTLNRNCNEMTENSSVNETCSLTTNEFICAEDVSDSLETPSNFIPTYSTTQETLRKRHMSNSETSKHLTKSEQEFVIHHEHCENVDNVSSNDSSEDIVRNASQHKSNTQGLRSELNHESEHLTKDLTQNATKGLYNYNIGRSWVGQGGERGQLPIYLNLRYNAYPFPSLTFPNIVIHAMWSVLTMYIATYFRFFIISLLTSGGNERLPLRGAR